MDLLGGRFASVPRVAPMLPRIRRFLRIARDTRRLLIVGWHVRGHVLDIRDVVAVMRFAVLLSASYALCARPPKPASIRLRSGAYITISDRSELHGLHEVFVNGEYSNALTAGAKVILDLGANIGLAAIFLAQAHPDARIVAVEGDPRTYERLVRNTANLPSVTPVLRVVGAEDGTTIFYSSPQSMSSSRIRRSADDCATHVRASTLATLLTEFELGHVDVVKIDIEGSEYETLRVAGSALEQVTKIVAEIHYDLAPAMDEAWLRRTLAGFDCQFVDLRPPDRYLLVAARR